MVEISIIMTVKNGENTIYETLLSIVNQKFKDFECIIVDDGSEDNTKKVIENMFDTRIKYYYTPGIGRSKALNMAISKCTTKYIANTDVDDPLHPYKLLLMKNIFDEHPDIGVLCTESYFLYEDETPKWEKIEQKNHYNLKFIQKEDLMKHNPISHSSVMFNMNKIHNIAYDEDLNSNVDYDLWFRLMHQGYQFCKIPLKISSKRIHKYQSYENKDRRKYLKNSIRTQLRGIRLLKGSKKYILIAYLRYLYGLLPNKIRMFRHKIKEI